MLVRGRSHKEFAVDMNETVSVTCKKGPRLLQMKRAEQQRLQDPLES